MGRRRSYEDILNSDFVSISELVRLTDIRYSTIKFYTEEGMLPFEQEDIRLTRRYPRIVASERLEEIKELKKKGLTILEIKKELKNK
ncbi:MerR family transcriptional regulator [Peribacillus simplex]|uniref:MerR family transcriptional regulator n=1 Tax=Peribacillus TaxID=2675229 RepID=UPI0007770FCA|nr:MULTISPECIES: MerR family transcriptional regulator [Peribacillus]AMM91459.1 MerR family transcriptional regulator [Peribacillus simplex]MDM5291945.1 MerR family transcriptional regulator [Peribacillus simplex]MDV7767688.1 helix-turn-helix domain-containing protein [Peribacillus sp. CSMR9]